MNHLPLIVALALGCCAHAANPTLKAPDDGFSGSIALDYDGSRHRTAAFDAGLTLEWAAQHWWVKLDLDAFSDFSSHWALKDQSLASLSVGTALYKNHQERLYINAAVEFGVPSLLADRGIDITPEINIAKGITKDWWIGGELAGVFSTSRNEGNRHGYGSLTGWAMWFCRWLPNESDALKFSVWAATNEVPGDDNALFLSLEYQFDVTDDLDASIGIGTDPSSPWERRGVYATALLRWSF
jgi:hypothetical protein